MENNLTEIVFVLDRSGSMAGLEKETVAGFNSVIQKQKEESGTALVTTVLFSRDCSCIHDRIDIGQVPPMTEKDYRVCGYTALLDAVGRTIDHIAGIHKYIREEDRPQKVLFIIATDGLENASHRYSYDQVNRLIQSKKELGWEFLFFGANIDASREASGFGISSDCAVDYHPDARGTAVIYEAMEKAIHHVRTTPDPLGNGWKQEAVKDFGSRAPGKQ